MIPIPMRYLQGLDPGTTFEGVGERMAGNLNRCYQRSRSHADPVHRIPKPLQSQFHLVELVDDDHATRHERAERRNADQLEDREVDAVLSDSGWARKLDVGECPLAAVQGLDREAEPSFALPNLSSHETRER
jgi:hypothetical protein